MTRALGHATIAPHEAFMMRLQYLDGIGSHDDAFAFALALDAIRAEDKHIAKAEARRAELLAFIHDATLTNAREQHPGSDDAVVTAMRERTAEIALATGRSEPVVSRELGADLLCELVLTSDPADGCGSPHGAAGGISARVAITVPVLSLLDGADDPALLDGIVPVPVEHARELASRAPSFLRVLTDPITGVARDSDTRFPTPAQREFLRVRDGHCRFPGCTRPARRCDIDHTIAVTDGGTSSLGNMAHLCRRHHTFKHATRWRVEQHAPGRLAWFSPNGHQYTDRTIPIGPRFTPSWAHHDNDHTPGTSSIQDHPTRHIRALDTSEHSIAPTIRPVNEPPRTNTEDEFELAPVFETFGDAPTSARRRLGPREQRPRRAGNDSDAGDEPPPFCADGEAAPTWHRSGTAIGRDSFAPIDAKLRCGNSQRPARE